MIMIIQVLGLVFLLKAQPQQRIQDDQPRYVFDASW